jgi:hypothetical protein
MLSYEQTQILRRLLHHKACISVVSGCDAFPAHPNGDRRKRPAFWIPAADLQALKSEGAIELSASGYTVVASVKRRLKNGKNGTAYNQHFDLQEREVYVSGGVKRQARVNTRLSALDRLAYKTDVEGRPVLDACLIEAGRHIARDYHASGSGLMSTQRYDSAGAEGDNRVNAVEDNFIRAADAKRRLQLARDAIGSGLDTAVIAVCCLDQSLDMVERAERWASGSGLTILKLGLSRLSAHYGTQSGVQRQNQDVDPLRKRTG